MRLTSTTSGNGWPDPQTGIPTVYGGGTVAREQRRTAQREIYGISFLDGKNETRLPERNTWFSSFSIKKKEPTVSEIPSYNRNFKQSTPKGIRIGMREFPRFSFGHGSGVKNFWNTEPGLTFHFRQQQGSARSLQMSFLEEKTLLIVGCIEGSRSPGVGFAILKKFRTRIQNILEQGRSRIQKMWLRPPLIDTHDWRQHSTSSLTDDATGQVFNRQRMSGKCSGKKIAHSGDGAVHCRECRLLKMYKVRFVQMCRGQQTKWMSKLYKNGKYLSTGSGRA